MKYDPNKRQRSLCAQLRSMTMKKTHFLVKCPPFMQIYFGWLIVKNFSWCLRRGTQTCLTAVTVPLALCKPMRFVSCVIWGQCDSQRVRHFPPGEIRPLAVTFPSLSSVAEAVWKDVQTVLSSPQLPVRPGTICPEASKRWRGRLWEDKSE